MKYFLSVLSILFCGVAMGDSITQTATINATTTDWNKPLVFNKFDSTLGKLTGVEVILESFVQNDYTLKFPPTITPTSLYVANAQLADPSQMANSNHAPFTGGPEVDFYGPNGAFVAGKADPVVVTSLTRPSGTYSSLNLPGSIYINPTAVSYSYDKMLDPSMFVGAGPVSFDVLTHTGSSFYTNSGNGSGEVLTQASAWGELVYTYSPVPEPTSLVLSSIGLIGLIIARRFV